MIAQSQRQLIDKVIPVLIVAGRVVPDDSITVGCARPVGGVTNVGAELDALLIC